MDLIAQAFTQLYPDNEFNYIATVKYSGKFKPYNARVQLRNNHLQFRLSTEWKEVDEQIVIGLIQHLLLRMFGGNKKTFHIDLYHSFLKKLPTFTEAHASDPLLAESFKRVNEAYFSGFMGLPSLTWGQASTRTLAHYNLHTDTITVSTIFQNAPQHLLDYVMHHEMLHKKHQFTSSGKHTRFHTTTFREDEKKFGDAERLERELQSFLRGHRAGWRWV